MSATAPKYVEVPPLKVDRFVPFAPQKKAAVHERAACDLKHWREEQLVRVQMIEDRKAHLQKEQNTARLAEDADAISVHLEIAAQLDAGIAWGKERGERLAKEAEAKAAAQAAGPRNQTR